MKVSELLEVVVVEGVLEEYWDCWDLVFEELGFCFGCRCCVDIGDSLLGECCCCGLKWESVVVDCC